MILACVVASHRNDHPKRTYTLVEGSCGREKRRTLAQGLAAKKHEGLIARVFGAIVCPAWGIVNSIFQKKKVGLKDRNRKRGAVIPLLYPQVEE